MEKLFGEMVWNVFDSVDSVIIRHEKSDPAPIDEATLNTVFAQVEKGDGIMINIPIVADLEWDHDIEVRDVDGIVTVRHVLEAIHEFYASPIPEDVVEFLRDNIDSPSDKLKEILENYPEQISTAGEILGRDNAYFSFNPLSEEDENNIYTLSLTTLDESYSDDPE